MTVSTAMSTRGDERAYDQQVARPLKAAEDGVRVQQENVSAVGEWAAEALTAFRAAEDKARAAGEYARQQRKAYERAEGQPGYLAGGGDWSVARRGCCGRDGVPGLAGRRAGG